MTPTTNNYDGDADGADADGIRNALSVTIMTMVDMSRQVLVVVCKTISAVVGPCTVITSMIPVASCAGAR